MLEIIIVQSTTFYVVVFAIALRWKAAGNVNAIGVHVSEPSTPMNLFIFVFISIVKTTVKVTSIVLVKFFVHCLFLDFFQSEYREFSIIMCAGYNTSG